MGRRKIDIVKIDNARHRMLTFMNRKQGLIRKATELAILCGAEVGVIIFGSDEKKMTVYSSSTIEDVVERWRQHKEEPEVITTEQYFQEKALKRDAEAALNDADPSEPPAPDLSAQPVGPPLAHVITPMVRPLPSYMCLQDPHVAYGHPPPYVQHDHGGHYGAPHPNGGVQPSPPGYAYHSSSASVLPPQQSMAPYSYSSQPVATGSPRSMQPAPPPPVHPTCYLDESPHAPPRQMSVPHPGPPGPGLAGPGPPGPPMMPVAMRGPPEPHAPHNVPPPQMPQMPQMQPLPPQPGVQQSIMPPHMASQHGPPPMPPTMPPTMHHQAPPQPAPHQVPHQVPQPMPQPMHQPGPPGMPPTMQQPVPHHQVPPPMSHATHPHAASLGYNGRIE